MTFYRVFIILVFTVCTYRGATQTIEGIYFNLYTDSLKKGFYNYINVDGKYSNGAWLPLDSTQIKFTANTGTFKGNALFIDSSYTGETITVKAMLKANPLLWKETIIYIRKRGFDEPLKTNDDVLNDMRSKPKKGRQRKA